MRYDDYLALLAMHESQGNGGYLAHQGSFLGMYQFGPSALQDTGFMDKQGNWTGKFGVYSGDDFRNNPDAQESAIDTFNRKNWGYIQHFDYDDYIGENINGTEITPYGLLAGYHLVGGVGLGQYLGSNGAIDTVDGNGTPISHYLQGMAGYPDPADNFSRGPFVAFPDSFAATNVNDQFAQGLMPPGWDQFPDPFAPGYGQLPNPNIGGPFDPSANGSALPDPNAGGPFAANRGDEWDALQNQLNDLQNSIQSLGSLFQF